MLNTLVYILLVFSYVMFFMSFIFTCHSLMNALHVTLCFSHNDYLLLKDSLLTMLCSQCDFLMAEYQHGICCILLNIIIFSSMIKCWNLNVLKDEKL